VGGKEVAAVAADAQGLEAAGVDRFQTTRREELAQVAVLLSRVAADIDKEGVMPQRRAVPDNGPPDADPQLVSRNSLEHTLAEQRLLRTHLVAAKHQWATEQVTANLDRRLLDTVRRVGQPIDPTVQRIFKAAMYLLGQKETEVAVWAKCQKVVPPHLGKEMAIINLRDKVEPRQFALAAAAIEGLTEADVATEAGPNATVLFRWLHVMLDARIEAIQARMAALRYAYDKHNKGPVPSTAIESE